MKQAWESVVAYKLVWFRVLCYFLIPFLDALYEQFKDWDGDAWDFAHWFVILKSFLYSFKFGLICLVAFYDQSLARTRNEQERKQEVKRITAQDNNNASI